MPKFMPTKAERLEYDFTPVQKTDGSFCSGQGAIPEPDRGQLKQYREELADAYKKLDVSEDELQNLRDGETPARMMNMSAQLESLDIADDINAATRNLLANFGPVLEHYEELPVRFQDDFAQWLMGELLNPEGQSAGDERLPEDQKSEASSTPSGATSG